MTNFAAKDLTVGQLNALVKKIGGEENVLRILSNDLRIQLLSAEDEEVVTSATVEQFITVPSGLSYEKRIARGDNHSRSGWNHKFKEKQFPVTQEQFGEWEWKLFKFNNGINSRSIMKAMESEGFIPAQFGHILAFREDFPGEQLKYTIIALGSHAEEKGVPHVPVIYMTGDGHHEFPALSTRPLNSVWNDRVRFLGVRRRSI